MTGQPPLTNEDFLNRFHRHPAIVAVLEEIFRGQVELQSTPAMTRLSSGQATLQEWRLWGAQRYMTASKFVPFLEVAIQKADIVDLTHVVRALHKNLDDEHGIQNTVSPSPAQGPHSEWRKKFYSALGLSEEELKDAKPLPATIHYFNMINLIQLNVSEWTHIGAVLALEFSIGREMEMIEKGLKTTEELRDIFTPSATTTASQAAENILYVQDHGAHELQNHFPALALSIDRDIQMRTPAGRERFNKEILPAMLQGIKAINDARTEFYYGLS